MEESQSRPADTSAEHGVTVNELHLPTDTRFRADCLCGWASPSAPTRPRARADGIAHIALSNPTLAKMVAAIESDEQMSAALDGLTSDQRREALEAVAAHLGEWALGRGMPWATGCGPRLQGQSS